MSDHVQSSGVDVGCAVSGLALCSSRGAISLTWPLVFFSEPACGVSCTQRWREKIIYFRARTEGLLSFCVKVLI